MRNCVVDEGRPFGAVLQEEAPNHLPLLRAKAVVVSRGGKKARKVSGQVTSRKRNESELPFLMSKRAKTISELWLVKRLRDQLRRNLFTGGAVSGI